MVSAGLSERLGTDKHVSKSVGSERHCKSLGIAWVCPFRSAKASARAGSIQAAGERPAQIVIRRVDCGAPSGGAPPLPRARKSDQNAATFVTRGLSQRREGQSSKIPHERRAPALAHPGSPWPAYAIARLCQPRHEGSLSLR
jgi:hypothetical protein